MKNNTKKILLNNEIITDDKIKIDCPDTSFCNIEKIKYISIKEVLKNYKELIKLAKSKGCKISYRNRYKKTLLELEESYEVEYKKYNDTFNTLKKLWQAKLKKGLFYGYGNDKECDKISEIDCKMQKFNNIRKPIYIINSINNKLKDIKLDLQHYNNDGDYKIFL